ncbi:SDR family oxidoreductase [Francisella frigiditurris]|uniref:Short chain dehydrogenase family protein n=1 Tax=Francisella frigiditurris TaxID=1542390 RepID=A0A1J0KW15_9GAMM|nr:SDR family oxidoreductase [Francisella frigiditurris]APC97911.1 short chain dehydrogenase family protein [Francisella frigiditurris]
MQKFKNKHVVIFGASSGMGRSVSIELLELGANISICARRKEHLDEIVNIKNDCCLGIPTDVTNKLQVKKFISEAIKKFGPIDYLVNSAGVMYYQRMTNNSYDEWLSMVNINVIGLLNILHSSLKSLVESKGMLINITSDAGRQAFPGLAVYSGTKAFMEFTLRGLRHELVESGVRVVNIQPGNVATSLHSMSSEKDAVTDYKSENDCGFLDPENIADCIIYAMTQPAKVAINEILIEPQSEPI